MRHKHAQDSTLPHVKRIYRVVGRGEANLKDFSMVDIVAKGPEQLQLLPVLSQHDLTKKQ